MIAEIGEHLSLRDKGKSPYQCSFATSKEWSRQLNAFDKSVKRALYWLPVLIASLNFSIRTKTQCYMLYPFRNPHWLGNHKLVFHTP